MGSASIETLIPRDVHSLFPTASNFSQIKRENWSRRIAQTLTGHGTDRLNVTISLSAISGGSRFHPDSDSLVKAKIWQSLTTTRKRYRLYQLGLTMAQLVKAIERVGYPGCQDAQTYKN